MKESQEFQEEQKLANSMPHKNLNSSKDFNPGKRLGLVLLSSIFVIELLIMLLGRLLKIQFSWFEAPIDSLLLSILISPVIYFMVIRPLTIQNNERKRMEDALLESESKYRSLVETAQELVWKCDANGRFTYLNPAWEKTHGYKVDEMLGKNFSEFQRPEVFERDIIEFTRHMAGGSVKEYETNHNTKDGKELTLLFNAIPLFDQNGNVIGTQGTAIDITERKHAERLLKESEFRLKFHIENSPMATIEWDTDFIVTRWAGEAEKIFGWSASETIGKPIMDLQIIYEEDIPIVEKTMERLTDGISKNIVSINRNYTKHRKIIYCEWYNSILYNAKGEMISVMSQVLDITDRKLVEKALQENEKRYHMLFQNLIVGFALHEIILDAEGKPCDYRFLEINPAFELLTGLKAIDLIGKTNMEVLRNTEPYWIETYGKVALTGKEINFENYSRELGKHYQVHAYSPEHGKFATVFLDITDHKTKELKILESEANLAEAQRIAHIGSWDWDLGSDTVKWSKEMFRVFDIDPGTYDGKPEAIMKVLHPDDVELFTTSMNIIRAGDKLLNLEYRVIHKDGSIHTILAIGRVELNEAGAPVKIIGIVQDITERKLAEKSLLESEERYRLVLENSMDAILFTEPNGTIFSANPAACEMFQRTEKEICQVGRNGLVEMNDQRLLILLEERARTGKAMRELTMLRKDGAKFPVEISTSSFLDRNSEKRTSMFIRDITERKQAEEEQRDYQERLSTILNTVGDPIFVKDNEHRIILANQAFYDIFALDENTTLGKTLVDHVPADEREQFLEVDRRVLDTGISNIREESLSVIGRNKRVIVTRKTRFVELSGNRFLVGSIHDITERKMAEDERKQSQEKLRAFAAMLQQKREEERKGIAREIHDEFGQVLTAIKMNLTILGNEVKRTDIPFKEVTIIEEINTMKNIIDLTIQKVRIFTNKLRPDVLDTFGLVEALDTHIGEFGKLYNLKCNFVKPDDEIAVDMDKSIAVYRIVQEALTNVARHANATEVCVIILKRINTLILSVEDNGIGMVEKQLVNKKKFGITGMKERAFICGGSITISSPQNGGTKVELILPIKEND